MLGRRKRLFISEAKIFLSTNYSSSIRDQLRRASISMVINIAEGSGKFSRADKRNFYRIARGSVYECVSLLELILDDGKLNQSEFNYFYEKYESVSKMLMGLINSQQ